MAAIYAKNGTQLELVSKAYDAEDLTFVSDNQQMLVQGLKIIFQSSVHPSFYPGYKTSEIEECIRRGEAIFDMPDSAKRQEQAIQAARLSGQVPVRAF